VILELPTFVGQISVPVKDFLQPEAACDSIWPMATTIWNILQLKKNLKSFPAVKDLETHYYLDIKMYIYNINMLVTLKLIKCEEEKKNTTWRKD